MKLVRQLVRNCNTPRDTPPQDDPYCDMPPGAGWEGFDGGCGGTGAQGSSFAPNTTTPRRPQRVDNDDEDGLPKDEQGSLSTAPVLPIAWLQPPKHAVSGFANASASAQGVAIPLPAGVAPDGAVQPGEVVDVDGLDGLVAAINVQLEAPPGLVVTTATSETVVHVLPRAKGEEQSVTLLPRPSWST